MQRFNNYALKKQISWLLGHYAFIRIMASNI